MDDASYQHLKQTLLHTMVALHNLNEVRRLVEGLEGCEAIHEDILKAITVTQLQKTKLDLRMFLGQTKLKAA